MDFKSFQAFIIIKNRENEQITITKITFNNLNIKLTLLSEIP